MTALQIFYWALGLVFIVLGLACVAEKYRTVRGGTLLTARILKCEKDGPKTRKGSGGYRYTVEFEADGVRRTALTNDAFWFNRSRNIGQLIAVWYNPASPHLVERKSPEAELLSLFFVALGVAVILWLGIPW
ncbi:MAG: DUF3592 domain-containing protein [Gemmiger sp.]|uniref:DUF3592 domain-containing protein n=1 Tax=Gemmiger sp. TaxID=2049027 RepID=UPI002E75C510|nr:DUF3592 domain-containing protein [Gemmiger sp.]MEE0799689.1 DUF3592 domain-containing protein [Gemmiger sp.]